MRDRRDASEDVDQACARLRDLLLETHGLGRRDFLRALAASAAGSMLLSPLIALAARAAERPVTYFSYGGAWKQAIMGAFGDPFTKKTGIPVQYEEPYSFAKLRAMHGAKAQQIDVVGVNGMDVYIAPRLKMITPVDWRLVDKSVLDPQQLHHTDVIGCLQPVDERVLQQEEMARPTIIRIHGRISGMWRSSPAGGRCGATRSWTMEAALKADGVKDDAFYPLDVERAFRSLDRIKPHIKTWWSDNSQAQQLMEQEGRSHPDQRARHPVDPRPQGGVRDDLERKPHLCRPRRRLDRAGGLPEPAGRDEVSGYRRASGASGGVRAAALLRASASARLSTCSSPSSRS